MKSRPCWALAWLVPRFGVWSQLVAGARGNIPWIFRLHRQRILNNHDSKEDGNNIEIGAQAVLRGHKHQNEVDKLLMVKPKNKEMVVKATPHRLGTGIGRRKERRRQQRSRRQEEERLPCRGGHLGRFGVVGGKGARGGVEGCRRAALGLAAFSRRGRGRGLRCTPATRPGSRPRLL